MKREEINKAIGEITGWEFCERARTRYGRPDSWTIPHCRHPSHTCGIWRPMARFQDFTSDLNAIHEAEGHLPNARGYADVVRIIVARDQSVSSGHLCDDLFIRATAIQRAESFLRILNLWKD